MEQILKTSTRTCHSCQRELPLTAFYVNLKTQVPDYFCKDCRSAACRKRYHDSHSVNNAHTYPVITDIKDRALRMEFIRHARQVVHESIEQKRKKDLLLASLD